LISFDSPNRQHLYFGEIASSRVTMAEAISLAKELNDMHGLAEALAFAGILGSIKRDAAEVGRVTSDLIELSRRHHFAQGWLQDRYFAAGRAALSVTQLKASRGSRME
jgi:hypothetical protein